MVTARQSERVQPEFVLGVLAGGAGTRMGGRDKAALPAPGGLETLLERLVRVGRAAGFEVVLVGGRGFAGVPLLRDVPPGVGPIGGLCALLAHAGTRPAVALACDMPYVSAALLQKLAREPSGAAVIAPRDPASGKWQPLFARYDSARVLPPVRAAIAGRTRSLQALFGTLQVHELALSAEEHAELRDWDEPGDVEP
jgi:molybdopterin-guanine dinucleotide biosynthesis protein A